MNAKKCLRILLLPPFPLLLLLLPSAAMYLGYTMVYLPETAPLRIGAYVLSAYTLTIWCLRIPAISRWILRFRHENPLAKKWFQDVHLRTKVTLTGNLLWNSAYGILQLGLGLYHRAPWYYTLAGYYLCLALMRFFLVQHTLRHKPGAQMVRELKHYRGCGWIFLFMNLVLSAMVFYMIHENRCYRHHEITTIAMAAYTFTALTLTIINLIRYRKYNSPVFSASKAISLASALVSMITLESSMLTTFSGDTMSPMVTRLFLALTGGVISIFIVIMALYMILKANYNLKCLEHNP